MIADARELAHYFCVCCNTQFGGYEDYCGKCQTPVSLSQSVVAHGGGHTFISVLGASSAGKTVYLGLLLDILSKEPADFRGAAASAFSVGLQEHVVNELENRSFPEKTPAEADAWNWLHCKLTIAEKRSTRSVDLISPDFAGEAIAMEMQQPGLYPVVANVVRRSSGILILCDSVQVRDHGSGEDLFAMKLASYIAEQHSLYGKPKGKAGKGPSLAIVFTKTDACPEAVEDPTAFAANNAPRLYEFCRQTFRHQQYFAAGIAGSTGVISDNRGAQMRVPFHIQPYGVLEPLRWTLAAKA
ncbi:MAG: hypothetical protein R3C53_26700 [Pirellulaceae bacterium]